jgi:hypothetical protein
VSEINRDDYIVEVKDYGTVGDPSQLKIVRLFATPDENTGITVYTGAHGIATTEEKATEMAFETLSALLERHASEPRVGTEVDDNGPGVEDDPEDPDAKRTAAMKAARKQIAAKKSRK